MVFTSVGHLLNREMLKDCHEKMDGDKAVGIDGVTKEEYGRNLEENLEETGGKFKTEILQTKTRQAGRDTKGERENKTTEHLLLRR